MITKEQLINVGKEEKTVEVEGVGQIRLGLISCKRVRQLSNAHKNDMMGYSFAIVAESMKDPNLDKTDVEELPLSVYRKIEAKVKEYNGIGDANERRVEKNS